MEDKVECAICYETYNLTERVTTLMCGHKFCTRCILQHMWMQGFNTQCPLCRATVFSLDDEPPTTTTQPTNSLQVLQSVSRSVTEDMVDGALERKREKRRLQRKMKRQRKREEEN